MKTTEIFLDNQRRYRQYSHYDCTLHLGHKKDLYANKSILVIGGGTGVYGFKNYLLHSDVTNVDLHIDPDDIRKYSNINSIQADFVQSNFPTNRFDEIWALFSLPLYSVSVPAIKLFFLKALLSLKPGGLFRVAPCTPHELSNKENPAIRRKLSQKVIFKNLYKVSDWFVENGCGNVDLIWADENFKDAPNSYSTNPVPPTRIDGAPSRQCFEYFDFAQYKNINHYRSNSNPSDDCMIISKSVRNSDETNSMLEKEIRKLYKKYNGANIAVYIDDKVIQY